MDDIKWRRKAKDRKAQQELKRKAILDVAAYQFTSKGFVGTSLDDIAQALDVTKPAIYYYFKNKKDILIECVAHSLELVSHCFEISNRDGTDGLQKLRIFTHQLGQTVVGDYGYRLIREANLMLRGEDRVKVRRALKEGQAFLEDIINEGVKDGTIGACSPKFLALLVFSAINQMPVWYQSNGALTPAQLVDKLLDPLLRGLQPDGP